MLGIHSVGVGVGECQSEDSFVCFGTKPTQRVCARDFLCDRKKTRKSKVVNRRKQSTEVGRWRRSEKGSRLARSWNLWIQKPGQPTREDESAVLVACVGISLGYTLVIARCTEKTHKSVTNFSFLAFGANPSPCLLVLLFFHSRLCMLCLVCL